MYRLYDYDEHTLLVESLDEGDIFNALSECMEEVVGQRYLIVSEDEETHTPDWRSIKNVRDYYNYALEYNMKLKNKSCMELKKEITDRAFKRGR